jgi:MoaA/NifB/PqqE/SkfB family radical SAM enzyme
MCNQWKLSHTTNDKANLINGELNYYEWQTIMRNLRRWLGIFHMNFNGGEVLIKDDFVNILNFASSQGILAGFVTNGLYFSQEVAKEVAKADTFNVNFSIDSIDPKIHDYLRGISGCFDKVVSAIEHLKEYKIKYKSDTRIIIKTTIMDCNVENIPQLIRWVKEKRLTGINLQPIIPDWTNFAKKQAEIDIQKFNNVIDEIIHLKKEGYPVLNPLSHLMGFKNHFEGKKHELPTGAICAVGVKNYFINPDGNVFLCQQMKSIGSLGYNTPESVWRSLEAEKLRKQIKKCKKSCLLTCTAERTFIEKIKLFHDLITSPH